MADESKPRLGRGLAALLGDAAGEPIIQSNAQPRRVPIEKLRPNAYNPRKTFLEDNLEELAQSLKERGILQPLLVRSIGNNSDMFEIIAGERRWRAAQRAGLHEAPVIKIEADDKLALEIAIIENVQRSDLNALEEADGYHRLIAEFNYSHQDLGKTLGKSRSHVTNMLRLLKLPEQSKTLLAQGEISAGHARALLAFDNPDAIAQDIVRKGLSVRDVEALSAKIGNASEDSQPSSRRLKERDPQVKHMEKTIGDALGMAVTLRVKGEVGEVRIQFTNLEQLDLIYEKLQS